MKRFDIITEADARVLDYGSTVELAAGGLVTPLARDTLSARRITVVAAGASDAHLPADLAPVADVRRVTLWLAIAVVAVVVIGVLASVL